MKALNNYCGGAAYASLAEAVAIGRRYGLSTDVMLEVINTSTGRSFTSQSVFAEEVATGRYASGFLLSLLAKDVGIAAALAAEAGVEAPVCDLVTSPPRDGARRAWRGRLTTPRRTSPGSRTASSQSRPTGSSSRIRAAEASESGARGSRANSHSSTPSSRMIHFAGTGLTSTKAASTSAWSS